MTNCELCGREIEEDEVEPACECGMDGCCADCMATHLFECEEAEGDD